MIRIYYDRKFTKISLKFSKKRCTFFKTFVFFCFFCDSRDTSTPFSWALYANKSSPAPSFIRKSEG